MSDQKDTAPKLGKTLFRSERVDVGGHCLNVEVGGRGEPLLILHGFTGSTRTVRGLAEALASRHRTIRVDLMGHGRSDVTADPADYRLERCVEDLGRVLDHVLPADLDDPDAVRSVDVLGYSMGGRIALGLAAMAPERVRSLTLIGASAGIERADERDARRQADEDLADLLLRDGITAFVDQWMTNPFFETQRELGTAYWEEARAQRLDNQPLGLAMSLRAIGTGAQPPLHEALGEIGVPVLLVAGARDEKFVALGRSLAEALPRCGLEVIPDAGHAAHIEQPEAVHACVAEFLATCQAERRGGASESASANEIAG